jgi:hypothetical protein
MSDLNEFVQHYVALWNEPDADRRRAVIAELWSEDGVYVNQIAEYQGHDAIADAVLEAHQQFVEAGYTFVAQDNAVGHHDVARFSWDMVRDGADEPDSIGTEVFVLAKDGRINADYQFIEKFPS